MTLNVRKTFRVARIGSVDEEMKSLRQPIQHGQINGVKVSLLIG